MDVSQLTSKLDTIPKHLASPSVPAISTHQYAKQQTTPVCPSPTAVTKSGVSTRSQTKLCASSQPSPVPQVDGAGDKPQADISATLLPRLEEAMTAALKEVHHKVDILNELVKHDQGVG